MAVRAWKANALSAAAAAAAWIFAATALAKDPQVRVKNGTYEGLYLPSFDQDIFLGIPYAQDTGGQNRFRIPQPLNTTWDGIRTAKQYGHTCPDPTPNDPYGMSENCLNINIVRPAGLNASQAASLPVAVWIHGGSYQVGTSSLPNYNLTYLVQRSVEIGQPIVATSINYRKGGWGMLYSREIQGTGQTNLALRDMRHALAWIQENIAAFGGNKSQVTIWGESAGSFAVGQLLLSYGGRTDGLFHGSIQQSGSAATAWYNGSDWYQPIYDNIVTRANCSSAIDTLACLRTVPYPQMLPLLAAPSQGPGWYPTVDGDIIPAYPTQLLAAGRFAHVPHLYGTNSDEGTDNAPANGLINTTAQLSSYLAQSTGFDFPAPVIDRILALYPDDPAQGIPLNTGTERFPAQGYQYKRIAAILGDTFYHAPRLVDARAYGAHAPTYIYRFNTRPWQSNPLATTGGDAPAYKGVSHFAEVAFIFANPAYYGPWPEYKDLSRQMSEQWIRFVATGNPNAPGLPAWPRYAEVGGAAVRGDGAADGLDAMNPVKALDAPNRQQTTPGTLLVLQATGRGQNGSHVESDTWRLAGREFLSRWARRRHV